MEKKNQAERPAFPIVSNCDIMESYQGLTKREYFAGLAMQGLLAAGGADFRIDHTDRVAGLSCAYAEALLKELEK